MNELINKIIKRAYELQFLSNDTQITTVKCIDTDEELYKISSLVRHLERINQNIIFFKQIQPRFGLYSLELNSLKQSLLQDYYENKITLEDLFTNDKSNSSGYDKPLDRTNVTNNYSNHFNSYGNSTQNISITYDLKNNIEEFKNALREVNIPSAEIEDFEQALIADAASEKVKSQTLGLNVQDKIKNILNKVGDGVINASTSIVVRALVKALTNYYGFPVEF